MTDSSSRPGSASVGRSPVFSRRLTLPSLVSKSDIMACIDTEIDYDQDKDEFPAYADCTCVRYKSPSPPPPLFDSAESGRRPLPPPPPPPIPASPQPTTVNRTQSKSMNVIADDASHFPNSLPGEEEDLNENSEANLAPRFGPQRNQQQYQQLRKVRKEEKICDAWPESVSLDKNDYSVPQPLNDPKNVHQGAKHVKKDVSLLNQPAEKIENPNLLDSPSQRLKAILRSSAEFHPKKLSQSDQQKSKGKSSTKGKDTLYRSRSISPPSTSSESAAKNKSATTKARSGSGILKKKHINDPSKVRISLFYTWSFSGQKRKRPALLLPPTFPGPAPQSLVDPVLVPPNHIRSYSVRQPLTRYHPPGDHRFLSAMPRDYHGAKRTRSTFSTAPRNFGRQSETLSYSSRTLRPSQSQQFCSATPYNCYSTINETPQFYRSIFPYTTLYRTASCYPHYSSQQPAPYQTLSPGAAPYFGQYNNQQSAAVAADLMRSIRRQHRYMNAQSPSVNETSCNNRSGFDVYVTDTSYHPYSTGTLYGGATIPSSSQVNPWADPVEETGPANIEKIVEQTVNDQDDNESETENGRCSSRACLIGWMLALTAVIILALAVGLFVQISREASRFEQLQRRQDQFQETTSTVERQSTLFK